MAYTWSEARGQMPPAPAAPATNNSEQAVKLQRIAELAYAPGSEPLDRRDLVVLLEGDEAMVLAQLGKPAPFTPGIVPVDTSQAQTDAAAVAAGEEAAGKANIPAAARATRARRSRKAAAEAASAEAASAEPQLGLTPPPPAA